MSKAIRAKSSLSYNHLEAFNIGNFTKFVLIKKYASPEKYQISVQSAGPDNNDYCCYALAIVNTPGSFDAFMKVLCDDIQYSKNYIDAFDDEFAAIFDIADQDWVSQFATYNDMDIEERERIAESTYDTLKSKYVARTTPTETPSDNR